MKYNIVYQVRMENSYGTDRRYVSVDNAVDATIEMIRLYRKWQFVELYVNDNTIDVPHELLFSEMDLLPYLRRLENLKEFL